ncbi:hypothetical protein FRB91_008242 [Serendipita sp. 411]|nr:hypothetical protein FRC20_002518 [Serendipita sp. 405]KAG8861376.1 hypothetical protein FRB91_008242 [Serendipita sp. 411]
MSMAYSTANWHWKTKHVSGWAKEWFKTELGGASTIDGDDTIKVERVSEVDGDVELGQRKSKLITIYDCKVVVEWSAIGKDETTVKGTCVIPEVSHENTIDGVSDYVYEYTIGTSSGDNKLVNALVARVKALLPPLLEEKFKVFPQAILDVHGKDLTVVPSENDTPGGSGTATPAQVAPSATTTKPSLSNSKSAAGASKSNTINVLNTATVKVSSRFMASAEDLYGLLTDESRIPTWSRAAAQSQPSPGGAFSLFGGGVAGKSMIIQEWQLSRGSWPSSHYGTMTITLEQGSDSTNVEFSLDGVPKGQEEDVERGLEGYYIRGFKSIGYVQVSHYSQSISPTSSKPTPVTIRKDGIDWKGYVALALAGLFLAVSIIPALTHNATR